MIITTLFQTSPADGRILHYGICENGILEQVKGVNYSLKGFLGPQTWRGDLDDVNNLSDEEYYQKLKLKPGHELYHCVIYLAPGDYHRFHSASDWKVLYRRHFPGKLEEYDTKRLFCLTSGSAQTVPKVIWKKRLLLSQN